MQRYTKTGFDPNATIWMKVDHIDAPAALLESESAQAEARSIGSAFREALGRCLRYCLGSAVRSSSRCSHACPTLK